MHSPNQICVKNVPIIICVVGVWIVMRYLLFEKQTFNGLLKVIGLQMILWFIDYTYTITYLEILANILIINGIIHIVFRYASISISYSFLCDNIFSFFCNNILAYYITFSCKITSSYYLFRWRSLTKTTKLNSIVSLH